jgi:hypothetical protein
MSNEMHVSVCSASLGIWPFTQNGQPTGVHISCNFVSVRAPKSDNFHLGLRSSFLAFSSCPAKFSHYSVYHSFTWHYSRRIILGNNPPPPHDAYFAKKYCKWTHFVQLCPFKQPRCDHRRSAFNSRWLRSACPFQLFYYQTKTHN